MKIEKRKREQGGKQIKSNAIIIELMVDEPGKQQQQFQKQIRLESSIF